MCIRDSLYEENDILGGSGDVDIDKLRAKGKGCLLYTSTWWTATRNRCSR